jgi:hypothetical protein
MAIWYIFTILVCCTKKNLATLIDMAPAPRYLNAVADDVTQGVDRISGDRFVDSLGWLYRTADFSWSRKAASVTTPK